MGRCKPRGGEAPLGLGQRGECPTSGLCWPVLSAPSRHPSSGRGRRRAAGVHARHHRVTAGCGAPGHGVQNQHATGPWPRRAATTGRRQQDGLPGGACPIRHVVQGGALFRSAGSAGGACHWAWESHVPPSECRRPRCDACQTHTHACVAIHRGVASRAGRRHCMLPRCEARLTIASRRLSHRVLALLGPSPADRRRLLVILRMRPVDVARPARCVVNQRASVSARHVRMAQAAPWCPRQHGAPPCYVSMQPHSSDSSRGFHACRADLRRSRVTDGHVSSGRTSYSCFLTNEKARGCCVRPLSASQSARLNIAAC